MATIEENTKRYEELLLSVDREGIPKLLSFLHHTDFFEAPASSRFHLACPGGLVQHSLNVYDCLAAKKTAPFWKDVLADIPDESIILIALLHDICKADFYALGTKNQKTYDPEKVKAAGYGQVKHDAQGDFVWETVATYQIDDKMPLGHGEKSALLAQCYVKLTMPEVMAVRWHMGFSVEKGEYQAMGAAMEKYPIVLAIHEADLEASKIMEVSQEKV